MQQKSSWNRCLGLFAAVSLGLAVSACGGGGGEDPAASPPPSSPPASSPPAPTPATLRGSVSNAATGAGLEGVQVTAGGQTTTTDASGAYTLPTGTGTLIVSFTKAGFAEQTKVNNDLANAGDSSFQNASMLAFAASVALTGTAAQTVTVANSTAAVGFPADGLRRADGSAAQGAITVNLTPIDPSTNVNVMPGTLVTQQAGAAVPIESFGALNVNIADASGTRLNLRSGQSATIRIPAVTRGTVLPPTIPLFNFNTTTGQWVQEGTATLFGTGSTAYYQGTVTHFSTWNADQIVNTVFINSCVVDSAGTRVANARITSEGINYIGNASALSDSAGNFRIAVKSNSVLALTASSNGRAGTSASITTLAADVNRTECLTLTQSGLTIKLSWGALPDDLDSHIWAPNAAGTPEEIFYGRKGSLAASPFVNLDVDDTDSFGPEFISIARVAKNTTYRYWVRNFSQTFNPGQTGSPARVEVNNRGVLTVFTPPAGEGNNNDWHAFDLTTDANCTVTVVPVNRWLNGSPPAPTYSGAPAYCN